MNYNLKTHVITILKKEQAQLNHQLSEIEGIIHILSKQERVALRKHKTTLPIALFLSKHSKGIVTSGDIKKHFQNLAFPQIYNSIHRLVEKGVLKTQTRGSWLLNKKRLEEVVDGYRNGAAKRGLSLKENS